LEDDNAEEQPIEARQHHGVAVPTLFISVSKKSLLSASQT
jgi:hypothetical protein